MRVVFLSMLLPSALTLFGPIYYGVYGAPNWRITVWALASVPVFLWLSRDSFRHAYAGYQFVDVVVGLVLISVIAAAFFLAADFGVYFLVRSISN